MDKLFLNMENEVLHQLLLNYPVLLSQLENASIIKRTFTGVGFYTDFYIDEKATGDDMHIHGAGCILNVSIHIGFILFVEKGQISQLEGYTYGFEHWPETIQSYEVFEEKYVEGSTLE